MIFETRTLFDDKDLKIDDLGLSDEIDVKEDDDNEFLWLNDNTNNVQQDISPVHGVEKKDPDMGILGHGIVLKGDLTFKDFLCIDGTFEGNLHSNNGVLKIGKDGIVKSNINLRSAVIEGRVEGDMVIQDMIELKGNAQVHGNIRAKQLRVEDGVTIIGHVCIDPKADMESEPTNIFLNDSE